jgi:hypothetical protein
MGCCLKATLWAWFLYSAWKEEFMIILPYALCAMRTSVMAWKPAIQGGLFFSVTLDAKAHSKGYFVEPVHGFYLTVTSLALYLLFDVSFVIEKDMLREIIDFDPRDRCPAVEVLVLLLDFRMIGDHISMTEEALFHGRHTRKGWSAHIGMAELALDVLHAHMNPMAEGDGLFRA